jgi:hypothetical protein
MIPLPAVLQTLTNMDICLLFLQKVGKSACFQHEESVMTWLSPKLEEELKQWREARTLSRFALIFGVVALLAIFLGPGNMSNPQYDLIWIVSLALSFLCSIASDRARPKDKE